MDDSKARHYARLVLENWDGTTSILDRYRPSKRQTVMAALIERLTMEDAVAILKDPLAFDEKRNLALKRLGKFAGREFATAWDFSPGPKPTDRIWT